MLLKANTEQAGCSKNLQKDLFKRLCMSIKQWSNTSLEIVTQQYNQEEKYIPQTDTKFVDKLQFPATEVEISGEW